MTPLFVPFGTAAPSTAAVLAVDGAVAGARAIYSHWQGNHTTPAELSADTSTGMLVQAAYDAPRWLAPFSVACNNHVDADGLLSLLCACRPDLALRHAPLLIAAATAGDFTTWTGESAFRLVVRLHQLIRTEQAGGAGWEQRAMEAVISNADALLASDENSSNGDPLFLERNAAVAQVADAIDRLNAAPPQLLGRLAVVTWPRRLGHATDQFLAIAQPDDLPLIALSTVIPPTCFQLLMEQTPEGLRVALDAPRHSWAKTVDLPAISWPDTTHLAASFSALEPSIGWTARPGAELSGFTCLLASRGPSRLDPALVAAACADFTNR